MPQAAAPASVADALAQLDAAMDYLTGADWAELPPFNGASIPLDIGCSDDIPEPIRRAIINRDRHCQWPGGCDKPPAACEPHHLVPRSRGGHTSLTNLKLFCWYHQCATRRCCASSVTRMGVKEPRRPAVAAAG